MRYYYTELRQAERLGKESVRDLIYVLLKEIEEDKDANELERFMEDVSCVFMINENKELKKLYNELAPKLIRWYEETARAFKA